MSVRKEIVGAMKGAGMGAVEAAVQAAPESWLPGAKPDPLSRRTRGLVGAAVSRIDGPMKVQGKAPFAAEFVIEEMGYAALAYSTIPKGRIAEIDTREAEAASGVVLVMTHRTKRSYQRVSAFPRDVGRQVVARPIGH